MSVVGGQAYAKFIGRENKVNMRGDGGGGGAGLGISYRKGR